MAITQVEIANQMIKQLRVLDPSASAEVGTPERKIIDTVAQALADAQIDLTLLTGAFDLDSKVGDDLDQFLSVFGFARQKGTVASGVVEFSRTTASNSDIRIPSLTQLAAQITLLDGSDTTLNQAIFQTTSDVILRAGETVVSAPIRSTQVGSFNNVAAHVIETFVGNPTLGITGVTNPTPVVGGQDAEDDDALKVRFRNTIFRNLAGTSDQFLALAVTGIFTNKANVIGPISRFREYLQIPEVDDATPYDVNGDGLLESGNGAAGEFTTALSTVPYSEYTYDSVPVFLSTGTFGIDTRFYMQDVDFEFNTTDAAKNRGDAYRMAITNEGPDPLVDPVDTRPSITAVNVYEGNEEDVEAIRPGDTLVFEHSYVSSASRNDWARNITNCVDVYVNGTNPLLATSVIPTPRSGINEFVDDSANRFHYENFRRVGEPDTTPILGNIFSPLYWSPIISIPEFIVVDDVLYSQGIHYWAITDVSENRGTIRARTGIEWSTTVDGQVADDPDEGPYTGPNITDAVSDSITVLDYAFDKNIIDLQSALEGAKQVTTDVLVHQADLRYFKFDVSVMYNSGSNRQEVNQTIRSTLETWLNGLYFGSVIQLSDVLQQIHNTPGVDNVRWSREVDSTLNCVTETNSSGVPRTGEYTFNEDFFLKDSELPALPESTVEGDSVAGLIIRPRTQSTWRRG